MSEILKKNLEAIAKHNLFLLEDLLNVDYGQFGTGVAERLSNDGRRDVYFTHGDKRYLLHSSFNPQAEAVRLVQDVEGSRDCLFVVFGIGLGFHLFALKDKISRDSRVIVVEHNIDVLNYALINVDFSDLFDDGRFMLLFGDEGQQGKQMMFFSGLNLFNLIHNIKAITLPNYYIYADKNKAMLQQLSKVLINTVLGLGNDLGDQFNGFANMALNTDVLMKSNSIDDIKGIYKNKPAIIVSAGPSLDKNIQYLKEANGKALIIACDASMTACKKNEVKPEAITTIERGRSTYQYYYEGKTFSEDLVLVAPGSIWPAIYEEFPGRTLIMSRNPNGYEQIWLSEFESFRFVALGHSCSTVAFQLAREAGCNPIILIGQDLAYSSGKKHSDLTHTEYEGANDDRDSDGVYVEDCEGNLLKSTEAYRMFKEWFELQIISNPELKVIDATEGGAYIKGSELMTLKEAIGEFCQRPLEKHFYECLPPITVNDKEKLQKYENLLRRFTQDITFLNKIKKAALAHMKTLITLEKRLTGDCSEAQLKKMVLQMQRGNKIIQQINEADSINCYYAPLIVQTIMQVKRLGNTLTQKNVAANCYLQHNLMFMIANSVDLVVEVYENVQKILIEKANKL